MWKQRGESFVMEKENYEEKAKENRYKSEWRRRRNENKRLVCLLPSSTSTSEPMRNKMNQ